MADRVVTLPGLGGGMAQGTAAGGPVRVVDQPADFGAVAAPGRTLHCAHRRGALPLIGQPAPVMATR